MKSEFTVWLVGSCLPDIQREEGGSGGSHPELVYSYSNKQLPTNLDALKRLFYKKKTDMKGKPLSDVVQKVVLDIMDIWYLAKIPFMQTKNATKKLENLFNKWRWLQKREKNTSAKDLENRKEFSDKLGLLFDIASQDWEKKISTDRIKDVDERAEDLNFLVDQRGPRVRYLGEFSEHFAEAVTDKEAREASSEAQSAAESARQEKVRSEAKKRRELATKEIICENNNDEDFEVEAKKAKKSKTVTLEVPRKILQAPGVCQMLDRTKQTTRSAMGNLATFITASGGDLEDFNLSTQTVWLTRNAKRVEEYEKFYESFQPPSMLLLDGMVRLSRRCLVLMDRWSTWPLSSLVLLTWWRGRCWWWRRSVMEQARLSVKQLLLFWLPAEQLTASGLLCLTQLHQTQESNKEQLQG